MNPYVRERIQRKLDTLSDERLYQVLDYVEFLETKYAAREASPINVFQRFAEGVEDKMRVGGIAVGTITETMGYLNRAVSVLNGVAQTTMNVASDVVNAASRAADQVTSVPLTNIPPAAQPADAPAISAPPGRGPVTNAPGANAPTPPGMPPKATG